MKFDVQYHLVEYVRMFWYISVLDASPYVKCHGHIKRAYQGLTTVRGAQMNEILVFTK